MSSLVDQARSFGFRVSNEFIDSEESAIAKKAQSFKELKEILLKRDLRKKPCMDPFFPPDINGTNEVTLDGPVVLQIMSIANISQPSKRRQDENKPRLLLVQLTDGHSKVNAVELEMLQDLKASMPPGVKILYKGGRVKNSKILLSPSNCTFLGGEVAHLLETWQANNIAKRMRAQGVNVKGKGAEEGPPKFELMLPGKLEAKSSLPTSKISVSSLPSPISTAGSATTDGERSTKQPDTSVRGEKANKTSVRVPEKRQPDNNGAETKEPIKSGGTSSSKKEKVKEQTGGRFGTDPDQALPSNDSISNKPSPPAAVQELARKDEVYGRRREEGGEKVVPVKERDGIKYQQRQRPRTDTDAQQQVDTTGRSESTVLAGSSRRKPPSELDDGIRNSSRDHLIKGKGSSDDDCRIGAGDHRRSGRGDTRRRGDDDSSGMSAGRFSGRGGRREGSDRQVQRGAVDVPVEWYVADTSRAAPSSHHPSIPRGRGDESVAIFDRDPYIGNKETGRIKRDSASVELHSRHTLGGGAAVQTTTGAAVAVAVAARTTTAAPASSSFYPKGALGRGSIASRMIVASLGIKTNKGVPQEATGFVPPTLPPPPSSPPPSASGSTTQTRVGYLARSLSPDTSPAAIIGNGIAGLRIDDNNSTSSSLRHKNYSSGDRGGNKQDNRRGRGGSGDNGDRGGKVNNRGDNGRGRGDNKDYRESQDHSTSNYDLQVAAAAAAAEYSPPPPPPPPPQTITTAGAEEFPSLPQQGGTRPPPQSDRPRNSWPVGVRHLASSSVSTGPLSDYAATTATAVAATTADGEPHSLSLADYAVHKKKKPNGNRPGHRAPTTMTSSVDGSSGDGSAKAWICKTCTFLNHGELTSCEMCDGPK